MKKKKQTKTYVLLINLMHQISHMHQSEHQDFLQNLIEKKKYTKCYLIN
jgi:hypothetical protein